MNTLSDEIIQFWKTLEDYKLRYIVAGDFACVFHGARYHTGILELWIDDTSDNRERLADAFNGMFEEDYSSFKTMEFVCGWNSFRFISGFDIEIVTGIKGFEKEHFNECLGAAPVAHIFGVPVRFLDLDHLIASKQAAGSRKDLIQIDEIKRVNETK